MLIILQTARLYLRRFTATDEDAALILALNCMPEVLQYLHEPVLQNKVQALNILETIILPQYEKNLGRWAIHSKTDHSFIGWCGLKERPELNEIDLGYRLLPAAWNNGYATEAASACLQYGFRELQLPEIIGRAHIQNIGSIRVLQKTGMNYIGEDIIDDWPVKVYKASFFS